MGLTSTEHAEIAELYGLGRSAKTIADIYEISKHSVRRIASEQGVKRGSLRDRSAQAKAWGSAFEAAAHHAPDGVTSSTPGMSPAGDGASPSRGATGEGGVEGDSILVGNAPSAPAFTRRCRNKQCINRFVPVNVQNFFCSDCRSRRFADEDLWSVESILAEEGSLVPGSHPLEMARRAFGQKNQALRQVSGLTSLREYLRHEVRAIHEEMPQLRVVAKDFTPSPYLGRTYRELIVFASDWQVGKLENGVGVNVINMRVQRIADATNQIRAHFEAAGHQVNRIHIVFGGDMIEGCYIYGGQNVSGLDRTGNTHRLIRQIGLTAQLQSELVRAISEMAEEVVVHSVPGNHGRPNGKNDFADPEDNFDTLTAQWAQDKCVLLPNVKWDIAEDWFSSFDVMGHPIVAIHGDQWRGPLWNLEKLLPQWVLSNVFGCRPELLLTAHRHDFAHIRVNGVHVVQNGTIDGGSNWFLKSTGKASPPAQAVLVMSEQRGLEATYPLYFPDHALSEAA